ncbi:18586_t:CDS:2 [Gigaspora margarita]|uniref:18586_t:CDS:1 n=1 Tax=Gigaspora margarita TaxID=4874 RepID=A0ABN7UAI6_GIGMA|nr:18586_t:CDS:2 [Gigaspora margarita]
MNLEENKRNTQLRKAQRRYQDKKKIEKQKMSDEINRLKKENDDIIKKKDGEIQNYINEKKLKSKHAFIHGTIMHLKTVVETNLNLFNLNENIQEVNLENENIQEVTNLDNENIQEVTNPENENKEVTNLENENNQDVTNFENKNKEVTNLENENIQEVTNPENENIQEVTNLENENIQEVTNPENENIQEEVTNLENENIQEVTNLENENTQEIIEWCCRLFGLEYNSISDFEVWCTNQGFKNIVDYIYYCKINYNVYNAFDLFTNVNDY